jgi:hypothetical protein
MTGMLKHGRRRVIVGTVVIGLGAASTTWAMVPDQNGVIQGCYTNVGGVVRVIDTDKGQKCSTTLEKSLAWNQKGEQGVPGPAGPKGEVGPAGPHGDVGPVGPNGEVGPAGPAGPKGDAGQAGTEGEAGPAGPKGDSGREGPQGPKGDRGPSDAFYAWNNLNGQRVTSQPPSSPYGVKYIDVILPPGNYVVSGAMKASGSAVETNVTCFLYHRDSPAGGSISVASGLIAAQTLSRDPDSLLQLPLWGVINSPNQPAHVRAECTTHDETVVNGPFIDVGFTATRVENFTLLPAL